jgi:cell division inhibitor SulA
VSNIGLKEVTRKWLGTAGGFPLRDVFRVQQITGTASSRSMLEILATTPLHVVVLLCEEDD